MLNTYVVVTFQSLYLFITIGQRAMNRDQGYDELGLQLSCDDRQGGRTTSKD